MKTKEELNELREEIESMNKKLAELNEDELQTVTGGFAPFLPPTTLAGEEYNGMFNGCTESDTEPDLPAKKL